MSQWYYVDGEERKGPISEVELQALVASGDVRNDTHVWKEGMDDWQVYETVALPLREEDKSTVLLKSIPEVDTAHQTMELENPNMVYCTVCGTKVVADTVMAYENHKVCLSCKPDFVRSLSEGVSSVNATGDMVLASRWRRLGAHLLDSLIVGSAFSIVIVALVFIMVGSVQSWQNNPESAFAFFIVYFGTIFGSLLVFILYEAIMVSKTGATFGKKIVGIKVVTADGGPVSFGRALGRGLSKILSGMVMYIGYLMLLFDSEKKRALHDHICSTSVVDSNS